MVIADVYNSYIPILAFTYGMSGGDVDITGLSVFWCFAFGYGKFAYFFVCFFVVTRADVAKVICGVSGSSVTYFGTFTVFLNSYKYFSTDGVFYYPC